MISFESLQRFVLSTLSVFLTAIIFRLGWALVAYVLGGVWW